MGLSLAVHSLKTVSVFAQFRLAVLKCMAGGRQKAAVAELVVAGKADQDDRLAARIAALAQHRHTRHESEPDGSLGDALV